MTRDPSLHIKESDLVLLLQGVFKDKGPLKWDCKAMASELVEKAKSYSVPSRSITVSNDKLAKKTDKLKLAGRSNTALFAQTLLHIRRQLKHRGLTLIKVGDKQWLDIKEACSLATNFCDEFQLGVEKGYKEYIRIGISKMANFSVYKFHSMHASICNHYEAMQEIERDPYPAKTQECHDLYLAVVGEKTGFTQSLKNNPEKYKCFIKVREEADRFKVSYKIYIRAQFAGFEWKQGVPDPLQLVGEKAITRLQAYAFEHSILLGEKGKKVDFKMIKKNVKNNHNK